MIFILFVVSNLYFCLFSRWIVSNLLSNIKANIVSDFAYKAHNGNGQCKYAHFTSEVFF